MILKWHIQLWQLMMVVEDCQFMDLEFSAVVADMKIEQRGYLLNIMTQKLTRRFTIYSLYQILSIHYIQHENRKNIFIKVYDSVCKVPLFFVQKWRSPLQDFAYLSVTPKHLNWDPYSSVDLLDWKLFFQDLLTRKSLQKHCLMGMLQRDPQARNINQGSLEILPLQCHRHCIKNAKDD